VILAEVPVFTGPGNPQRRLSELWLPDDTCPFVVHADTEFLGAQFSAVTRISFGSIPAIKLKSRS
jgi:hypothetical protein